MPAISALLHEPRWRTGWLALLLMLLGIVSWFAFSAAPPTVEFEGADKVNHLLAFSALACVAALCAAPGLRHRLVVSAGLLAYGGFIEIVQTQLPTRRGDWADVLADAAGIGVGLMFAALLQRIWRPETGPLR